MEGQWYITGYITGFKGQTNQSLLLFTSTAAVWLYIMGGSETRSRSGTHAMVRFLAQSVLSGLIDARTQSL